MFVYNFKNVDFEDNSIFVDSKPAHQRHKLFLFTKPSEHSPLMIGNGYNTFPFCAEDFLVLFCNIYPVLRFFHFLSFLIKFFCFNCVVFHERIYQVLFHFYFIESLRLLKGFKTFLPLKTENNQYTSKTSFTNKNATLLSTKHVLLDMIKGCKSTLPQAFLQSCFSNQPYQ